jgi:predicted RNA-binding Zn-ribbon protein involved in translation (DUF1610 family)
MPDFITLSCPSCGGKMRVAPHARSTICEYCGNEHVLRSELAPGSKTVYEIPERPPVPLPESVTLKKFKQGVRLVRRWFSWKFIPLAFFAIAWDAFLIFWYGMAFSTNAPWIFKVFPIAHLAVGVGLTYYTLAGFFNVSVIEITPQEFAVYHDPMPWPGEIKMPTGELTQLYCKEKVQHGENGSTTTYELCAILSNKKALTLLKGLDSSDVALYMEQQVERLLKISDQPVGGELPRGWAG